MKREDSGIEERTPQSPRADSGGAVFFAIAGGAGRDEMGGMASGGKGCY